MFKPQCGCYLHLADERAVIDGEDAASIGEGGCLYPAAVELNDRLQRRLSAAEAMIDRLLLEAGWMHTKAAKDAEEFLRPRKGD